MPERLCKGCQTPISGHGRKMYCNNACRQRSLYQLNNEAARAYHRAWKAKRRANPPAGEEHSIRSIRALFGLDEDRPTTRPRATSLSDA